MLPTAHLIPCEVLQDSREGDTRIVQLVCHQELLPLRESGPGYLAFWPQPTLADAFEDLEWEPLLAGGFDRGELLLPRSTLHRILTPEGQLRAFPVGDPFDLEPMAHQVDWTTGELITLTLRNPATITDLLGPEPPEMPRYQFCRVAYEIPEEQALERFAEVAQQIRGEHWRYICWALEEWPAAYTGQLPTLPHLASAEEPYDAAESFMVFDEGPLRRAQEAGWRHRGRVWTNPSSGLMEEGAVYAGFSPGEFGRIRCQWLHFHLAGQVVTALVPFDFTLVPAEALVHRWVTNEPFPEMP